jgi:NAD(P)-dependent dehydrogenase (short-subunit alcohol dehydrogenase family)
MNPEDKVALITGGAIRIGRAITLALAQAGIHVVINYHSSVDPAQQTMQEARALGVEAVTIQADVGDPEAVKYLVHEAQDKVGGVDILVNNASPFIRANLQQTSLALWHLVLRVALDGPFMLAQALSPGMIERGAGLIVNLLDLSAFYPMAGYLAHSVGKTGLLGLTRNLAVALAPSVRVNAIAPGPVLPPPDYATDQYTRAAQNTLLGRWGTPDDVVKALYYLIDADYVTGEVLFVDGGEAWKR